MKKKRRRLDLDDLWDLTKIGIKTHKNFVFIINTDLFLVL